MAGRAAREDGGGGELQVGVQVGGFAGLAGLYHHGGGMMMILAAWGAVQSILIIRAAVVMIMAMCGEPRGAGEMVKGAAL